MNILGIKKKLEDELNAIESKFTDNQGLFQQGKFTPVRQAYMNANNGNTLGRQVMQPLAKAQQFVESPTKYTLPQIQPFNQQTPVGKANNFLLNTGIQAVANGVPAVINTGLDTGKIIGGAAINGQLPAYSQLKSPLYRLAYNARGVAATPQNVIGNVAGVGADALDVYAPKAITGVAKPAESVWGGIKEGAKVGQRIGGLSGGLRGLEMGSGQSVPKQLQSGLYGASSGYIGGTVAGGALGGVSNILSRSMDMIAATIKKNNPKLTDSEVSQAAQKFARDELGRFAKMGSQKEDVYIKDPYITDAQRMELRRSLGLPLNPRGGFVDMGEILGNRPRVQIQKGNKTTNMVGPEDFIKSLEQDAAPKTQSQMAELISQDAAKGMTGEAQYAAEDQTGFKNIFSKWLGKRDAAKTTATTVAKNFAQLPSGVKGEDVIKAIEDPSIQTDPATQEYTGKLRAVYDDLYKQAQDAGLDMNYVDNYITHIWDKSPTEVAQLYAQAKQRAGFQNERTLPSYQEGIALGLKPKYSNPAQILNEYVKKLEQVKANVDFVNEMKTGGYIVPGAVGRKTPGFKQITAPGFPTNKSTFQGQTYESGYYAPTDIANKINKVFAEQENGIASKILDKTAKASSQAQDIGLSGGVPKTPINAFTIANAQKEVMAGITDPRRAISAVSSFVRSFSKGESTKYFEQNADTIRRMQELNVPVSSEYNIDTYIPKDQIEKSFGEKIASVWKESMGDPTFKRFLPMLQVNMFKDIKASAVAKGVAETEADQVAAQAVKNFYGIQDAITGATRGRTAKNALTTFAFAPHYREAMINFWVNNAKALKNPLALENRANTGFLVSSIATYAAMDALNQKLNGHHMYENPKGKEDKLLIPLKDGTTVGVPFLSSIATVPRAMFREGMALANVDFAAAFKDATQSYSSMLVKPAADLVANQDYFGKQIYDPNATTSEKSQAIGSYLAANSPVLNHPYIKELIDPRNNQDPAYQRVSRSLELPFRFYDTQSIQNAPFWDQYYKAKAQNEQYKKLKYKDPQKAIEMAPQAAEFARMKNAVGSYYDAQDAGIQSDILQKYQQAAQPQTQQQNKTVQQGFGSNDPLLSGIMNKLGGVFGQQQKKEQPRKVYTDPKLIKTLMDIGAKDLTNEEIRTYYLRDINLGDSKNRYDKAINEKKVWGRLSDVEKSTNLTENQKNRVIDGILKKINVKRDDYDYYRIASQDTNTKMSAIYDQIDSFKSRDEMFKYLAENRREVRGAALVNDKVLDNLYDDGVISKDEAKYLKNIKYDDRSGNIKIKQSSSGGRKKAAIKIKSAGKVSAPPRISIKTIQASPIKITKQSPAKTTVSLKKATKDKEYLNMLKKIASSGV